MILRGPSGQEGVFTDKPEGVLFRARFRPRLVSDSARDTECPPRPGETWGHWRPLSPDLALLSTVTVCLPSPPPSTWQSLLPGCASLAGHWEGPQQAWGDPFTPVGPLTEVAVLGSRQRKEEEAQ